MVVAFERPRRDHDVSALRATLRPDQIESMEEMVEGVVALCDCPADITGRIAVSLDLIADWSLTVHGLDGTPR